MKVLTRKQLKEDVKRGATFKDFEEKYSLDKDALIVEIGRLYKKTPSEVDGLTRKIAGNEKHKKKAPKEYQGVPIEQYVGMSVDQLIGLGIVEKADDDTPEIQAAKAEVLAPEPDVSSEEESGISEKILLEESIASKKEELLLLEKQIKQWRKKRREGLQMIEPLNNKLTALIEEFKQNQERYAFLAGCDARIVEKIEGLSLQYSSIQAGLEADCRKLEELTVIPVGVFSNGTVGLLESVLHEFTLNDAGWEEIFSNLSDPHKGECQDLRMREVSAISKMIAIFENDKQVHRFELTFDNKEMEEAYYRVAPSRTE